MSIREDFGVESRRWPLINKQRFQITRSKSEHCLSLFLIIWSLQDYCSTSWQENHDLGRESGSGLWCFICLLFQLFVCFVFFVYLVCLFVWYYMVLLHLLAKRIMIWGGSLACGRPSASVPKGDGPPTDITRLSYNQVARILNVS